MPLERRPSHLVDHPVSPLFRVKFPEDVIYGNKLAVQWDLIDSSWYLF